MPSRTKVSFAQKQLPFTAVARPIADPLKRERIAVCTAGAFILLSCVLYGYAIVSSIAEGSFRESAQSSVQLLSAERASLEGSVLAARSGITEEYARSLGFQPVTDRVFVQAPATLSYAEHAR
ncbi:hypothetical protein KGO06_00655 [Patescibacteria group bacterium]|nr:hypothetical protein [Patescibacteria group bacterium]